jgi:FtsH-binding integral membrane protein
MALDPRTQVVTPVGTRAGEIDEGLRSYMLRVYNYMALGVAFTGVVAMAVATDEQFVHTVIQARWILFFGILGLGFFGGRLIFTGNTVLAHGAYWLYAGLWGLLIGPYLYFLTGESVVRVFFITAAAFGGMSLYGYTTKRDLSAMGAFLCMSTFGILIAVLANALVFQSYGLHMLLSVVIVLVFAGITAWETQAIRRMYLSGEGGDIVQRKAIFGAFLLYGSFVTMFVWLLQLLGVARD